MKLNLENLSPISVSIYTRLEKFKNCIDSLAMNDLAKHSVIFIFSDAAKPGDEETVLRVRKYAKSIRGFKKVNLICQKKNNSLKNISDMLDIPLELNGKSIIVEDDIIVGKHFLRFMNEGLNKFEFHPDVYSVNGYCHPIDHRIKGEYFFQRAMHGWSIGHWKKKYEIMKKSFVSKDLIEYYTNNWNTYIKLFDLNPYLSSALVSLHSDLYKNSRTDDFLGTLFFLKNNKYGLYPKKSLAANTGHDGSGLHSGITDKYKNTIIYQDKIDLSEDNIVRPDLVIEKKTALFIGSDKGNTISQNKNFLFFIIIKLKCKFPKFRLFIRSLISIMERLFNKK